MRPSERLGRNVRAARLTRVWTQTDLAERLGLSQGWVSLLESGEVGVTLDRLEALSETLGVPVCDLLEAVE